MLQMNKCLETGGYLFVTALLYMTIESNLTSQFKLSITIFAANGKKVRLDNMII